MPLLRENKATAGMQPFELLAALAAQLNWPHIC